MQIYKSTTLLTRCTRQVLETFSVGRQRYNYSEITNKLHRNGTPALPRDAARLFRETPSSDTCKLALRSRSISQHCLHLNSRYYNDQLHPLEYIISNNKVDA